MDESTSKLIGYDPLQFYEDPYPIYRHLRNNAPVYRNEDRDVWVLSRYHDVQWAARDWKRFISGRGVDIDVEDYSLGPGDFLDLDPPRHDELRRVIHDAFSPKRISALESFVRASVVDLIEPIVEAGGGDLAKDFAQRLPLGVICELWGVPRVDHAQIEEWFVRMVERVPGEVAVQDDVWAAADEMHDYVADAVRQRRRTPRDDLLGIIARALEDGRMSEEEVDGMTRILLVAGIHTTSTFIANTFLLLEALPAERRILATEPETMPAAIEELLRYETPVQWLARRTATDVEVQGSTIACGERVILLWAAANRDERKFVEPDVLDFRRERVRHVAFGEGIHHCIGAPLARLESRIAFEEFFRRVPEYEVIGPVERMFTRQERGLASLPVRIDQVGLRAPD
jgi:cytochrome P450